MTHRTHSTPHGHSTAHGHHGHAPARPVSPSRGNTFSKIFRWQPAKPGDPVPAKVEMVASFTGWQPKPFLFDKTTNTWQLTLNDVPGGRTHSYMVLADGHPAPDKNSDGYAIPHTDDEKRFALTTARGPRVFMLFSQTR